MLRLACQRTQSWATLGRAALRITAGGLERAAVAPVAPQSIVLRALSNQAGNDHLRKVLDGIDKKHKDRKVEGEEEVEGGKGAAASATAGEEAQTASGADGASAEPSHPAGSTPFDRMMDMGRSGISFLVDNVKLAYKEMMGLDKKSVLSRNLNDWADEANNKPSSSAEQKDAEEEYTGSSSIVVVKDGKTAWEQMKERLQEAPFIQEVLRRSRVTAKAAANTDLGKTVGNLGRNIQDKVSDMREYWETSQNPLVYSLSGVVDVLTSQTEEAMATTAIRKLDPNFVKEEWAEEVRTTVIPEVIRAHLAGDIKVLQKWAGEATYRKLAADISTRKHDGYVFNSNILEVDENAILMQYLEDVGPIIVGIYMVQLINCIKNRKGEIVEGGELDIRAKFYSVAFQLKVDESTNNISWKIVDYQLAGDTPYI